MKYQHIHDYTGNKYLELNKLFKENPEIIDEINKYDTIVECYGGSFGFIRVLYSIYNFKDKKFIVYDTNSKLIDFYKYIQTLKYEEYTNFINEYNNNYKYLSDNFPYNENKRLLNTKLALDYIKNNIKNEKIKYLIINNSFSQCSMAKVSYKPINDDDYNLIKKITFINEPFELDKLDKNILYYIDPPYLLSTYTLYNTKSIENLLNFLVNDFDKYNIILNHEKNILFDIVFKHIKQLQYAKTYSITRNKKIISFFYNFHRCKNYNG